MSDDNDDDFRAPSTKDDGEGSRASQRKSASDWASAWRKKGTQQGAAKLEARPSAESMISPGTSYQLELLLGERQHRTRRFATRFALFVLVPTFIVWFYAALIATPRYVTNFEITYQTYQPASTLAATLTQTALGSSVMDSVDYGTLIYEYIRSQTLAEKG